MKGKLWIRTRIENEQKEEVFAHTAGAVLLGAKQQIGGNFSFVITMGSSTIFSHLSLLIRPLHAFEGWH